MQAIIIDKKGKIISLTCTHKIYAKQKGLTEKQLYDDNVRVMDYDETICVEKNVLLNRKQFSTVRRLLRENTFYRLVYRIGEKTDEVKRWRPIRSFQRILKNKTLQKE